MPPGFVENSAERVQSGGELITNSHGVEHGGEEEHCSLPDDLLAQGMRNLARSQPTRSQSYGFA